MRTSLFTVFALLGYSLAAPTEIDTRDLLVCPLLTQAACCWSYGGSAIFGCVDPAETPTDRYNFEDICRGASKQARCCARVTKEGWGEDCSYP